MRPGLPASSCCLRLLLQLQRNTQEALPRNRHAAMATARRHGTFDPGKSRVQTSHSGHGLPRRPTTKRQHRRPITIPARRSSPDPNLTDPNLGKRQLALSAAASVTPSVDMDPGTELEGTAEPGAAAWRTRAVGGTEYSWCRAVPGGTGTTLLALRLARGGTATRAEAAVRSLQAAHPVLRAHLRAASTSSPTLAFPATSSAPQLRLAPQPSALDFDSLLERELNRNPWAAAAETEPDGAPVFFAALYDLPAPAGGAALFLRIHTAACDRAASAALLRELLAHLGGAGAGDPESAAVEAGLEGRIPQKDAWKPFWARGVDMLGYSINGLRTSTLPFVESGTAARSTQMVRLAFGLQDTTRLLDVSCLQPFTLLPHWYAAFLHTD